MRQRCVPCAVKEPPHQKHPPRADRARNWHLRKALTIVRRAHARAHRVAMVPVMGAATKAAMPRALVPARAQAALLPVRAVVAAQAPMARMRHVVTLRVVAKATHPARHRNAKAGRPVIGAAKAGLTLGVADHASAMIVAALAAMHRAVVLARVTAVDAAATQERAQAAKVATILMPAAPAAARRKVAGVIAATMVPPVAVLLAVVAMRGAIPVAQIDVRRPVADHPAAAAIAVAAAVALAREARRVIAVVAALAQVIAAIAMLFLENHEVFLVAQARARARARAIRAAAQSRARDVVLANAPRVVARVSV
jgi:hypothetical protein